MTTPAPESFAALRSLMDNSHEDYDLMEETPFVTAERHLRQDAVHGPLRLADDIDAAFALGADDETRRQRLREADVLWWSGDVGELFLWLDAVRARARRLAAGDDTPLPATERGSADRAATA